MAVTLQNCLDKIGFSGTPTVSLVDLNDLYSKFIMECPVSTIHIDGTPKNSSTDAMNNIILNGIGGSCSGLSITFKFILDQIGFDSYLISIKNKDQWNQEMAVLVKIGNDSYFCAFSYWDGQINKPIKIEDQFKTGNILVDYKNPDYLIKNIETNFQISILTEKRDENYFSDSMLNRSTEQELINYNFLLIYLGNGKTRTYLNGKIRENEIEYDYDSNEHDLLTLFKFSGTI